MPYQFLYCAFFIPVTIKTDCGDYQVVLFCDYFRFFANRTGFLRVTVEIPQEAQLVDHFPRHFPSKFP